MALTLQASALAEHCKRGLKPLYAIVGDDALLSLESADLLRKTARAQGFDEREVHTVDPYFKWDLLAQATASQGLFSTKKIVEVRMPSGKPGRDGGEGLGRWCELLDENTLGILSLPKPDSSVRNSQWFAALQKNAVFVSCDTINAAEMPRFLQARLKAAGLTASEDALAFLSSRVEGNSLAAHQEILKLAALELPSKHLALEDLQDVLTKVARYDVDGLIEAVLAAHPARMLRVLEGLEGEGESPVVAHYQLQQLARQLLSISQSLSRSQPISLALLSAASGKAELALLA
jgi:DNA polymerase III subunit delta